MLHHYLPADAPVLRPDPSFPRAFIPESPAIRNQFSFWPRYDQRDPAASPASPFLGRDALFFSDGDDWDGAPPEVIQAFADVQPTGSSKSAASTCPSAGSPFSPATTTSAPASEPARFRLPGTPDLTVVMEMARFTVLRKGGHTKAGRQR